MGTVITEALALRRTPFGETSQVAEFMTRERGRLALILKGVHRPRSRMGGGVDLLDHCQLVFSARRGSRSLAPLRERRILDRLAGVRSRDDLLAAGLCVAELLSGLAPEGQAAPALFDLAISTLRALDVRPARADVPWAVFAWQAGVLRLTGFQPVLDRCVSCDRRPSGHRLLRCDPARGGIVCSACREPEDVSFPLESAAAVLLVRLADDAEEILASMAGTAGTAALAAGTEACVAPLELSPEERALEPQLRRCFERVYEHVLERRPRCRPLAVVA